ncbi:MFS transporter [Mycoplasmatota bacterium zrk1]
MLIFSAFAFFGTNFQHVVTPSYLSTIGLEESHYGFLFAFMALGMSISSPISGRIGDKYGTRLTIFFGFIGYAISQFLFGTFTNIYALVFVRLTAGLSISASSTNMISYLTKVSTPERRAKVMSYYVAGILLFVSVAYKFGGELGIFLPARTIIYLHALTCLIIAFISLLLPNLKGSSQVIEKVKFQEVINGKLLTLLFVNLLAVMAFTSSVRFMEVYVIHIGFTTQTLGNYVFISGLVTIIFTSLILPFISSRVKEPIIMKLLLLIGGLALWSTFNLFDNILIGLYSTFILFNMVKSGYDPMHNSYISKIDEDNQGQVIGISQSFKALGMVLGLIIGGYLYAYDKELVFNASAVLILVGFIILQLIKGDKNESKIFGAPNIK